MKRTASISFLCLCLAIAANGCKYVTDNGDTVDLREGCVNGQVRPCGVSVGECEPGQQTCEGGQWSRCDGIEPDVEVCDGRDNDCDGDIDEGCNCREGTTQPCGTGIGHCTFGAQTCSNGSWGRCSGGGPEAETCNGEDDDCDGEVDDGFHVGEPCTLAGGCVGIRVCSDDHARAVCVVDEAAVSPEVCDGIDNDCDGIVDFSVGPTHAVSACDCVEERLAFGAAPTDQSIQGGAGLCEIEPGVGHTVCDGSNGELAMSFCLTCSEKPYAMCQSETAVDLSPFVLPPEGRALTIDFTFESDTVAKTLVNLYYTTSFGTGRNAKERRRYFPLLGIGDQPGRYTRIFFPEHTCFAKNDTARVDCEGAETTCPACRAGDTCGLPTGSDCASASFVGAKLQLAVDLAACEGEFKGTVGIHTLSFGPLSCNRE